MTALLITGATTPLGRALVRAAAADPAFGHVLAVGREPSEVASLHADGVSYIRADLTRSRDIRELLFGPVRDHGVGTIVHMARHRRVDGRRGRRLLVESTRLMLRLAEQHPTVGSFVFRSSAAVYRIRAEQPDILREDQPLDLSASAPEYVRERVEADVAVCSRMGLTGLRTMVLRCAEIFVPDMGSQLMDYLASRVCLRPLGFDPMVNLLSVEDAVAAILAGVASDRQGVFNIPGLDTLPLSVAIRKAGRVEVGVPGPLLGPLYRLRAVTRGTNFRYDLNHWRFHYSGVMSGSRARDELGWRPRYPVRWDCLPRLGR